MKKLALLLSFVCIACLGLADETKQDEAKKTAEPAAEVSPADATTETLTTKAEEGAKAEEGKEGAKAEEGEAAAKAEEGEEAAKAEEAKKEAEKE